MANNVLKEFLVAVGFKVDGNSYKGMLDKLSEAEKKIGFLDVADRKRFEEEKKRVETRKKHYEDIAGALSRYGATATLVAGTVAAAAGVAAFAVGKMVGNFDQFYYISQRTGASVGNLKAMGYAFSQVGSTAESALQAIESFAQKRRTNPGIDGLLRSYGVDTKGDTADVLNRSVQAIQDRHPYYTGSQVAGLLGITEEQFQTFTKYRAEIKRYREEYARLQRDLNVNSDETARASASVSRSIGTITATLGVLAEKFFSTVAPVLERMVDGLRRWIAAHPEEIDRMMQGVARALEAVGMGLAKVGEWFSDEGNLNKFMGFWTNVYGAIERVVKIVTALLDAMFKLSNVFNSGPIKKYLDFMFGGGLFGGSIFGTSAQAAEVGEGAGGGRAPGERPGLARRGWNAVKRVFGRGDGGADGDLSATPGSRASIAGGTFDKKAPGVMKRLMEDFGLSKEEAGVVLGNLGHESAGFTAFEEGGNGPGRGWAQWTDPGRKRRFFEFAKKNGLDPKSDDANYGFLKWELQNTHKHAITNMKRADGSDDKMRVFERDFEGAGVKAYGSRNRYMKKALEAYDKSGQQGSAPSYAPRGEASGAMNPGSFNVDDALRSRPMGTTSNTNDNSRSVSQVNTVKVEVHGATDPAAAGAAAARGVGQATDMNLRNVQTAIR